jgi:hypothetical protein
MADFVGCVEAPAKVSLDELARLRRRMCEAGIP